MYPGYYKFKFSDDPNKLSTKGVILSVRNTTDSNWFYIEASDESNYFFISGMSGNARVTRICGDFDVLFDDQRTGKLVPATGEFDVTLALH